MYYIPTNTYYYVFVLKIREWLLGQEAINLHLSMEDSD